jgi:hypothetical protein
MFDMKKKNTYRCSTVLHIVIRSPVSLWTLSASCTFEIEFIVSCASRETFFLEDKWSTDWALSAMGASSIYKETAVKEEHISDMNIYYIANNREFPEKTVSAVVLSDLFSRYITMRLYCLISTIFQLLKENVV